MVLACGLGRNILSKMIDLIGLRNDEGESGFPFRLEITRNAINHTVVHHTVLCMVFEV